MVEYGNMVQFGPGPWQNYIVNVETGRTIKMERRGGSFAIKANFAKGLEEGTKVFSRQAW